MKGRRQLKEKVLSLILTFAMVIGMVIEPVQVSAAQPDTKTEVQRSTQGGDYGVAPASLETGNAPITRAVVTKVDVTPASASVYVNETVQLSAIPDAEPTGTIEWKSSNPEVASVDQTGLVTGLKADSVIISATVDGVTGEATINVDPIPTYTVSGNVLSGNKLVGGIAVSLDSAAPVKTTAEGVYSFEGVTKGNHTLTFSGLGFQTITENITVTADVTGKQTYMNLKVPQITVAKTEVQVGENITFGYVADEDLKNEVMGVDWTSSDAKVATIDSNGKLVAAGEGKAEISAVIHTLYASVDAANKITVDVKKRNTTLELTVDPAEMTEKVKEVTLTANVKTVDVPGSAAAAVKNGKVLFTITQVADPSLAIKEKKVTKEVTINNGVATFKLNQGRFDFSGKYQFEAKYLGTAENNESVSEVLSFNYTTDPIAFENADGDEVTTSQTNPKEMTYGDSYSVFVKQEADVTVEVTQKDESVLVEKKAESSRNGYDEFVITTNKVADLASVTFKKSAPATDVDGNPTVEELYTNFYVKVAKRVIDIDAANANISYSKVFDGDLNVFNNADTKDEVTFNTLPILTDEIEGIGVIPSDKDKVSVDLNVPAGFEGTIIEDAPLNADTAAQATNIKFNQNMLVLTGEAAGNYILAEKEITVPASVTVSKRTVTVTVSNAERQYGHALNNGIGNDVSYTFTPSEWVSVSKQTDANSIEGILSDDTTFAVPNYEEALKEVGVNNESVPSDAPYASVLSVDTTKFWSTDNQAKHNNYNFVITNGALTIVKETVSNAYLDLNPNSYAANTTMYIQNGDKVWVRAQEGALNLNANTKLYDQVMLSKVDSTEVTANLTDAGFEFNEDVEESAAKTLTLYFRNSVTGAVSEEFTYNIYLDGNIPTVTIDAIRGEETTLDKLVNSITFGNFGKTEYKATVTVGKDETTSGLNRWQYAVLPVGEDIEDGAALQAYMDEMLKAGKLSWSNETTETKDITVAKKNGSDADFVANNYVILVKPFDNVENSKVYTSMGFILDNTDPVVEIKLADGQVSKTVYDDDVKLQAIVSDDRTADAFSGLKEVYYQVAAGEENLDKAAMVSMYKAGADKTYSLDELRNEAMVLTKDMDGNDFQAGKELNSNNIWVRLTAVDNSENTYSTAMPLKIDTTKPTVTVEYETEATEKYAPYYNAERTAVITVNERNVDYNNINQLYFDLQREKDAASIKCNLPELQTAYDGIEVESVVDSQDGTDSSLFTDERTITIRVKFAADDKYNFDVNCVDEAGLADEQDNAVYFVIDKTAPQLNVSYYSADEAVINVPSTEEERIYRGKAITAKVEVTEHNFALADKDVTIDAQVKADKVGAGETVPDYHGMLLQNNTDTWAQNADVYTSGYTFAADANYTHSITYTDLAGNTATYGPGFFTVDKTKPTGTIKVGDLGFWESFLEKITFGLFSPTSVDVTMTGADHTSPVYQIQYARFRDGKTRSDLEAFNGWSLAPAATPDKAGFKVVPDEQFVVYTKVTDYAGNYEYFSSNGIIVDQTKPAPVVTVTNLSQAQNGIFNENVTLKIDVEDPTVGNTYSGLEKVWYTVSATGNVTASETITLMDNSSNKVQGNKTFSQVITVPADVYNSNDVKVQAFATDFAGNQGDSEVTPLKIDVTNPTISVVWDLNSPMNNRYYKETRTATVTITDRNFDPNNVRFSITNTDGASANISGWSSSSNIGVSDNATSTCQVSFPSDGDYTFTLGCTDLAGNVGEYGQTDEFTIDKTLPVLTVTYDNNNARNGNFYKETRTATVTIREHNFNAADVRAAITASLEGSGISAPSISGFSNSGDTHTATVSYVKDGDYTFDIDYTDMAGNQAADYTQDSFTVDLTAPEVEIIDIEDKSANNDVVSPGVNSSDVNFDQKNVTLTLVGAKHGAVEVGKVISSIINGQHIKLNDFARTEDMDDLYTLTVKVVDKAGNETEKTIRFSVNRYGSVFVLDNQTNVEKEGWLSAKPDELYTYINEEKEIGVLEYNVDEIESCKITVNRDGELANLKEKDDFTVTKSGTEVQWKETHYKIKAENFANEGNYTVVLNTQDKAKNAMNNNSVKKSGGKLPVEFTVDKTAPTVVVSGVEDGGRYRSAEKNITVDAKDNLALAEVAVSIDNNETVYTAEDLRGDDGIIGVIETSVASANNWQDIKVTAKDMAGNIIGQTAENKEEHPVVLRVLVTPNVVIQYYMNKPLFYGSIAVIVAIIALIIFLIWKKRKEDEEEQNKVRR